MTGTEYAKLLSQIKRHEGAVRDANGNHVMYRCPAGILTIGYGHNLETAPIPPAIAASGTPAIAASGTSGIAASGTPAIAASGTPAITASGASGIAASGTSGITASGTPAITASGTSGITASGTSGITASGTSGITASGTGAPASAPAAPAAPAALTPDQADRLLAADVLAVQEKLALHLPWVERLDPPRYAVLVNMAFNLGVGGLLAFKNTLAHARKGDYEAAAIHMLRSRWAAQVGNRAKELAEQMCSGNWQ